MYRMIHSNVHPVHPCTSLFDMFFVCLRGPSWAISSARFGGFGFSNASIGNWSLEFIWDLGDWRSGLWNWSFLPETFEITPIFEGGTSRDDLQSSPKLADLVGGRGCVVVEGHPQRK